MKVKVGDAEYVVQFQYELDPQRASEWVEQHRDLVKFAKGHRFSAISFCSIRLGPGKFGDLPIIAAGCSPCRTGDMMDWDGRPFFDRREGRKRSLERALENSGLSKDERKAFWETFNALWPPPMQVYTAPVRLRRLQTRVVNLERRLTEAGIVA